MISIGPDPERQRALAEMLMRDMKPIRHWSDGLSNAGNSLAAALLENRADEGEAQQDEERRQLLAQALGAMQGRPEETIQWNQPDASGATTTTIPGQEPSYQQAMAIMLGNPDAGLEDLGFRIGMMGMEQDQRQADIARRNQWREEDRQWAMEDRAADQAFRRDMQRAELAAKQPRGTFAGTSMEAQAHNILMEADPSSREYAAAHALVSQPRTIVRPDGVVYERPDLSWAPLPGGTWTAGRPSLTGGAAPLTGGTPQAAAGGGVRPFQAGEFVQNPDGTQSTERTVTIQTPTGEWVNVPSLWMGQSGPQQLNDNQIAGAMQAYETQTGQSFPRFGSLQEAEAAARTRSMAGGAGQGPLASGGMPQAPGMQQIGPNMLFAPFPDRGDELTVAQEAVDKEFAKEYTRLMMGGMRDVEKNLGQVRDTLARLQSGEDLTGGAFRAFVPGFVERPFRSQFDPDGLAVQEQFEEVVQRNLREVLGAQFAEREGELLIARAYNPALGEAENAQRVTRLLEAIEGAYSDKLAAMQYYEQNGTLRGFTGNPAPTIGDIAIAARLDGPPSSAGAGGQMGRGGAPAAATPSTGQVPPGVDPRDWEWMTPEERALFQ